MATGKVQASKVAASIKDLMDALDVEVLPLVDELRAQGWITADEYAAVIGRSSRHVKSILDKSKAVLSRKAKSRYNTVTMYKAKK